MCLLVQDGHARVHSPRITAVPPSGHSPGITAVPPSAHSATPTFQAELLGLAFILKHALETVTIFTPVKSKSVIITAPTIFVIPPPPRILTFSLVISGQELTLPRPALAEASSG